MADITNLTNRRIALSSMETRRAILEYLKMKGILPQGDFDRLVAVEPNNQFLAFVDAELGEVLPQPLNPKDCDSGVMTIVYTIPVQSSPVPKQN